MRKQCKQCDYENYVRVGRGDLRCPKCRRDITLELVLLEEARENSKSKIKEKLR